MKNIIKMSSVNAGAFVETATSCLKGENKKSFSILMFAIMIAFISTLASCEKETHIQSNLNWKEEIKTLNKKTSEINHPSENLKEKNWKGCAGADAGGALSGAAAGSEIGGLFGASGWGAVIGAAVGGAAASIEYWCGRLMDPTGGPTIFNPEPVISSNPNRIVGELHNQICMAAVNDPNIILSNGRVNMQRLEEISIPIIKSRLGESVDIPTNVLDMFSNENEIIISTIDDEYIPTVGNEDIKFFSKQFQQGIKSCYTKEQVHSYCSELEIIIQESELEDSTKGAILGSVSVMRNSSNLWYQ